MSKVETSPFGGFQKLPFPLVRKNGFRLAAGLVHAPRRLFPPPGGSLAGSAPSSTRGARGNGGDPSEIKGTFLLCQKGTFLLCRHSFYLLLFFSLFLGISGFQWVTVPTLGAAGPKTLPEKQSAR